MQGTVPLELKIARFVPIYKNGDEHIATNYRPVSILPVLLKVLEGLMFKRLIEFLNKHHILSQRQRDLFSKHCDFFSPRHTCLHHLPLYMFFSKRLLLFCVTYTLTVCCSEGISAIIIVTYPDEDVAHFFTGCQY